MSASLSSINVGKAKPSARYWGFDEFTDEGVHFTSEAWRKTLDPDRRLLAFAGLHPVFLREQAVADHHGLDLLVVRQRVRLAQVRDPAGPPVVVAMTDESRMRALGGQNLGVKIVDCSRKSRVRAS